MATISTRRVTAAVCAATLAGTLTVLNAYGGLTFSPYQAGDQSMAGMMHDAEGGNGADLGPGLFAAADSNTDGAVTRAEFKTALEKWFQEADKEKSGSVTEADLVAALKLPQPRLPLDAHMQAMLAALPDRPAAKPTRQHKVLVLNKCAGFVHTPIPLVAKMIESFGNRTKAWSTTITFDPADINEQNLKQYDALVLNSTTGAFLDDPNDQAVTDARKKALHRFRSGRQGAGRNPRNRRLVSRERRCGAGRRAWSAWRRWRRATRRGADADDPEPLAGRQEQRPEAEQGRDERSGGRVVRQARSGQGARRPAGGVRAASEDSRDRPRAGRSARSGRRECGGGRRPW